jgi:syndecan 4
MLHEGHNTSAIYSIRLRPDFRRTIKVFCEQTMLGGGWLVILRRNSGNLKFTQGWEDYKDGFGDLIDEHWIGNENLHQLTRRGNFKLMVYFYDNQKALISSTSCDFFNVTSSSEGYAWYFKLCKGPASHALSYSSGAKFSTFDRDNDLSKMNCAKKYGGGFWYKNCSKVTFTSPRAEKRFMVSYFTENGSMVEMPAVTMMIKPFQKSKSL